MNSKGFNPSFNERKKEINNSYENLFNKAFKHGDPEAIEKFHKAERSGDQLFAHNYIKWVEKEYDSYAEKEGSTFIHSKDYVPMKCCLCGAHMETIHDTHNPQPLTPKCYAKEALLDNLPHRCCTKCNNTKVNNARFSKLGVLKGVVAFEDHLRTII
tara:strand:- start:1179 stop:1649 length:471 start_codon:yes stop_codon:yes gene_type:complete